MNEKEFKESRNVDTSKLSRVLSIIYQKKINQTLSQIKSEQEKLELIEKLNESIGIEDFEYSDNKFKELMAIHDQESSFNFLVDHRPKTPISISTSTLFTGNSEPTLESELSREIRTADAADFLVSYE